MKKLCAFFFVYHIVVFKICASGFVRKRDNWLEILVSRWACGMQRPYDCNRTWIKNMQIWRYIRKPNIFFLVESEMLSWYITFILIKNAF